MHTEKYAHNIELITTPGIGDGNPAAAIALQQKIQKSSGQADLQILDAAALPGRWFHQIMTTKTGFLLNTEGILKRCGMVFRLVAAGTLVSGIGNAVTGSGTTRHRN